MRYLGGKFHCAKEIAEHIKYYRKPHQLYIEPFVGGFNIPPKVNEQPMLLSDINLPLINMYIELKNGWIPPDNINEEQYNDCKLLEDNNPLKAFVGFSCSFGGIYYTGYARDNIKRKYCLEGKRNLLKKIEHIKKSIFICCDYKTISPSNSIIYCDPPYNNSTAYNCGKFNTIAFWEIMRKWSKDNTVLISEYSAPSDFRCIWSKEVKLSVRSKNGCEKRVEKLFKYDG